MCTCHIDSNREVKLSSKVHRSSTIDDDVDILLQLVPQLWCEAKVNPHLYKQQESQISLKQSNCRPTKSTGIGFNFSLISLVKLRMPICVLRQSNTCDSTISFLNLAYSEFEACPYTHTTAMVTLVSLSLEIRILLDQI